MIRQSVSSFYTAGVGLACLLGAILIHSSMVLAQSACDVEHKLFAPESEPDDLFGTAVDILDTVAVVGAPFDDFNLMDAPGSAYILRFDGKEWQLEATLQAEDAESVARLGQSVALLDGAVLLGTPGDRDNGLAAGSVHFFTNSGTKWSQAQEFHASDGDHLDEFGFSVACSGDTAVIGAPFDEENGPNAGAAYVFRFDGTTWIEEQKLLTPSSQAEAQFGFSVGVFGDFIVVGAPLSDVVSEDAGATYHFEYIDSQWIFRQQTIPPNPASAHQFGYSVAINSEYVSVGAPFDPDPDSGGSVYMLRATDNGWLPAQTLINPVTTSGNTHFGFSVDFCDDLLVAGAPNDAGVSGRMLVFDYDGSTWLHTDRLAIADPQRNDQLGWSVACWGSRAVAAAIGAAPAGAAYILEDLPIADCNDNGLIDECDLEQGTSLDENYNDFPDECECDEEVDFRSEDGATGDRFGFAVALVGGTALVSADHDEDNGVDAGAVYVIEDAGTHGVEIQKLLASNGAPLDGFGYSIAMDSGVAVVSAPFNNELGGDAGSVYVFREVDGAWIEEQKLLGGDGTFAQEFGHAVAIDGNTLVVGAWAHDGNGPNSGAAYVFSFDGIVWQQTQQLIGVDTVEVDRFGSAVAIEDDTILVGAQYVDQHEIDEGAVYVYEFDGSQWVFAQIFWPQDSEGGEEFGASLSIGDGLFVVGAPGTNDSRGNAHIYRYSSEQWQLEQTIEAVDGYPFDWFGASVMVTDTVAIIGATGADEAGDSSGAAYVFAYDAGTWSQARLLAGAGPGHHFGRSAALFGDTAIIGGYGETSDTGMARMIHGVLGRDCNANGAVDACDIVIGASQDNNSDGVPDECQSCEGDANEDGIVDPLDSGFVLARLGCPVGTGDPGCDAADQNGDGVVDPLDLGFILSRFGACS